MTKIEFHILKQMNKQQAYLFACSLLEKIYSENQTAAVYTENSTEAEHFDKLLWIFRDNSFIPHLIASNPANTYTTPILIQRTDQPENPSFPRDILLNLSHTIPPNYQPSEKIIELVYADPTAQQLARERFKHYRDQGYDIITHQ